ncbi:MAG: hypothetical protein ACK54G_02170 [Pseudanabaena sp.]
MRSLTLKLLFLKLKCYFLRISDRLNLKSNSDRPSPPTKTIAYFPHQKANAPHHPQTRSPKSQNQTAIAIF